MLEKADAFTVVRGYRSRDHFRYREKAFLLHSRWCGQVHVAKERIKFMITRRYFPLLRLPVCLGAALLFALVGSLSLSARMNTTASMSISSTADFRAHPVHGGVGELPLHVRKFVVQQRNGSTTAIEEGAEETVTRWRTLSFKEVATLWQSSVTFAEVFAASLSTLPFEAIFWESAPVTGNSLDKPYEFVAVNAPTLVSIVADGSPFSEFLTPGEGTTDVVTFRNLRGDAKLVSPCRGGASVAYAHLANFVRLAPRDQVIKFFASIGAALEAEVASRRDSTPVWLSTSGLGVYWLHARLDSVPKYYTYGPYKASGE